MTTPDYRVTLVTGEKFDISLKLSVIDVLGIYVYNGRDSLTKKLMRFIPVHIVQDISIIEDGK